MRLAPFNVSHLAPVLDDLRPQDVRSVESLGGIEFVRGWISDLAGSAAVGTLLTDDDAPVAIMGAVPIWRGVAHIFMFTTNKAASNKVGIVRTSAKALGLVREYLDLHRLEAAVAVSDDHSATWMESMGLKREAVMRGYGPDREDHWLYARVWEG